ncbi:3-methyl-2-oxobutanoate hydroxymethyltransferase [Candidatus Woesearchaeota archaeon]|nr:3-methyl-2-oxobutanoate hydroxymethyltransferase [Candidatus Woesearchaeota archaeon]
MKIKIDKIKSMKGEEKISMLTAYDFPTANIMDGVVDMILVGDSLGMVVLGYENTLRVTMNDMIRHTEAVGRAVKKSLLVGDLPVGSYDNLEDAVENARKLIEAGADCIKIENQHKIARALVKEGMEVMGHIGLTPQTVTDFKVQGKAEEDAEKIIEESKELEKAGCFAIVLECVPLELAKKITEEISIPTIGIGAGIYCDGQVLVMHDILGLFEKFKPKFVKRYANIAEEMRKAFRQYNKEVKEGKFPTDEFSFH